MELKPRQLELPFRPGIAANVHNAFFFKERCHFHFDKMLGHRRNARKDRANGLDLLASYEDSLAEKHQAWLKDCQKELQRCLDRLEYLVEWE